MNRHDLIFPTTGGWAAALAGLPPAVLAWAGPLAGQGVPTIVRRQEAPPPGVVQVGLSGPQKVGGVRQRAVLDLPLDAIERQMTPFQVCRAALEVGMLSGLLASLAALCAETGLEPGLYGSAALEAVTGLAYMGPGSDIDLYLRPLAPVDLAGLARLVHTAQALAGAAGLRLDMELELPDRSACKVAELLAHGKTVLCKGFNGVRLAAVNEVLAGSL